MVARRRHKEARRSSFLAVAFVILLLGMTPNKAHAGFDFSGCRVPTLVDEGLRVVAELQLKGGDLVIAVNPFDFYYNPETMLWLYFRQCAFADRFKDKTRIRRPTPSENKELDCEAIRLMQERGLIDRFTLESIDRTVDPKLMPDFETQLGPFRRIDVFGCSKAAD